jgi:hypothetical protein
MLSKLKVGNLKNRPKSEVRSSFLESNQTQSLARNVIKLRR